METNETKTVATEEVKVEQTPTTENTNARPERRAPRSRGPRPARRGRGAPREKQYQERVIAVNRVSKTVKGGRRLRFTALVAIGDGKGLVAFGTGKANEVPDAIRKALDDARKSLVRVPIIGGDNATIPHVIIGKYGAGKVFLKPAREGTGVISGGPVRAMMELAGVKNIYSKVYGSRTPINIVRATMDAIVNLKSAEKVASLRGKDVSDIL